MRLEVVRVRLHDPSGDDVGLIELPAGWTIGPGDELLDADSRLVRVLELVLSPAGSTVAVLAKVERASAASGR